MNILDDIDISTIPSGMYIIQVKFSDGSIHAEKIVKERKVSFYRYLIFQSLFNQTILLIIPLQRLIREDISL